MRILAGIPEKGSRGGSTACEPPFIQELRRLGHAVEEEVYSYAEAQATLANRAQRVLRTAKRFRQCVRSGAFDIVHINTSFDTNALLRDAVIVPRLQTGGAKIFLKFHGSDAELLKTKNLALARLRHQLLTRADGIGVLSSEERANFLRGGVPEERVFQVNNVVARNTRGHNPKFAEQTALPSDMPLLLFISRFVLGKGLLDVIRACALLRDRGQKFLLICVGDGPERPDAEREVECLNLRDRIRFFGYVPEEQAADFYANSTMLIFASYLYEGFPMVIFNAAAAGLPIITTRIRAAADYLNEPDNCFWVEPQNPDSLARNITTLLENEELRSRMSTNNRKLGNRFSAEIVTPEYLTVYEKLLGERSCEKVTV